MTIQVADPLWGTPARQQVRGDGRDIDTWYSRRTGGMYSITRSVTEDSLRRLTVDQKALLTTWIVDQRRAGVNAPVVTSDVVISISERRPLDLGQKRDRFFRMLLAQRFGFDGSLKTSGIVDDQYYSDTGMLLAWCELRSEHELGGFMRYLAEAGLLTQSSTGTAQLTAAGFDALDAIGRTSLESTQAFVAMWFGAEMQTAYENGFAKAIDRSGYSPLRIDAKEHNNKIDDEIVLEIRRSRFVVADFTCPVWDDGDQQRAEARGGVYFEAGLAQGLGIEVIWTVREDRLPFVHFDTRQYAHIVWNSEAELDARLFARIGATIGLRR